jgi:hypothetical protein
VLHGGIVTALFDVACYLALLHHLKPDENEVTHEVTASLMRGGGGRSGHDDAAPNDRLRSCDPAHHPADMKGRSTWTRVT